MCAPCAPIHIKLQLKGTVYGFIDSGVKVQNVQGVIDTWGLGLRKRDPLPVLQYFIKRRGF